MPKLYKLYRQKISLCCLLITGYCLLTTACTPPTPPPSPTPWPTPTSIPVEVSATPQTSSTPQTDTSSQIEPTSTPKAILVPATVSTPTTIVVWESLPTAQTQRLAQDIDVFQTEFPQYHITLQHYHSPDDFMTSLVANQIEFDVILASPKLLGNLWMAEQVSPANNFFPPNFINGFAPTTLLGARRDDLIWGVPDTAGFHLLLFYNQNLVDTPPSNTADLFELAEDFTQGSQWGLGVNSYDPLWLTPWLAPHGGWLTNETGQPTLNTPAMEAAATLYLSWQGRLTGIAPVGTYDEVRTKFLNGDMAMMIDGDWAIGELVNTDKVDWAVTLLPNVGQATENQPAAPLVLARYWAISQTATEDRALVAATFIEFITQPEHQLTRLTQFGLLPTQREALNSPIIVDNSVWRISAAQMQAGRAVPLGVDANSLMDAMRRPLQGIIDGELTPRKAAEMMQANAEKQ